MKKVICTISTPDTVLSKNTDQEKYYGLIHKGTKGFIMREGWRGGKFIAPVLQGITLGNRFATDVTAFDTIGELCDALARAYPDFEFYEFDTYKELFSWLAE